VRNREDCFPLGKPRSKEEIYIERREQRVRTLDRGYSEGLEEDDRAKMELKNAESEKRGVIDDPQSEGMGERSWIIDRSKERGTALREV
jgi:hypothetical protein